MPDLHRALTGSEELVKHLHRLTNDLTMPSDDRTRLAAASLGITLDHHYATTLCIKYNAVASALALVRLGYEGYVRAEWITYCAEQEKLQEILNEDEFLHVKAMLCKLITSKHPEADCLMDIKERYWRAMCSYTHGGAYSLIRYQSEDAVEPSYNDAEKAEVLEFMGMLGKKAAVALLQLAGARQRIEQVESVQRGGRDEGQR